MNFISRQNITEKQVLANYKREGIVNCRPLKINFSRSYVFFYGEVKKPMKTKNPSEKLRYRAKCTGDDCIVEPNSEGF
jgi:hypothetical protein